MQEQRTTVTAGYVELHQVQSQDPGKLCSACRGQLPSQDMIRAVLVPWSADYQAGYTGARSDAWGGYPQRNYSGRHEGYRAGYRRGWAWAVDHPRPGAQ